MGYGKYDIERRWLEDRYLRDGLDLQGIADLVGCSYTAVRNAAIHYGVQLRKGGTPKTTTAERFWTKVDRRGPDECWEWTGARTSGGYGNFWDGQTSTHASRVSWELHYGPIPEDMLVCHHCDNRPCVNPAHLFLGTYADNLQDASNKGRLPGPGIKGEEIATSKLTEPDVLEIATRLAGDETHATIAADYGVSRAAVSYIARGESWAWLTGVESEEKRDLRGENSGNSKLAESDVLEIVNRMGAGETQAEIAADYGVCKQTVNSIATGNTWSWLTNIGKEGV